MRSEPICLRVKGPFACFTRPEFHVERVSYPVITPSAARGILEAILMKPIEKPEPHKRHNKIGFRWVVTRIGVVEKGNMFSILRNELGYGTHQTPNKATGFDVNGNKIRAQRHSLVLKKVEYLIEAVIEVPPETRRWGEQDRKPTAEWLAKRKYHQMFLRRAQRGQCFYQPFLGCREFSAEEWELCEEPPTAIDKAPDEEDFGMLFHDFDYSPVWNHWGHERNAARPPDKEWGGPDKRPLPRQFHAMARQGWISCEQRRDEA